MKNDTALKIVQIQEQAMEDAQYRELLSEYRQQSRKMAQVLAALPDSDRSMIEDYLGLIAQMHRSMLEMACQ